MPRKLQSAAISFGLVTIPVNLYTAVREQDIHFNQIHEKCGSRIKQQLYCPVCERVVERDEIVKGYEVSKGQYVKITQEELDKLEASAGDTIDIVQFVPLSSVDPIYFENTYFLGPDKRGEKPYALLTTAMEKAQQVALATFVWRGKESLVLVRPTQGGLMLHKMYHADEVRDFNEVPKGEATTTGQELDLAMTLIEQLSKSEFDPTAFHDAYRDRVLDMINKKAAGEQIAIQPEEKGAPVVDLMQALRASLEKGAKKEKPGPMPSRAERVPAKKAHAGRR
jgi:DNA end-binding protein Ku